MIDPTDLDDPAKAEAFLRETIDYLAERIAELEARTEEKIRAFRDLHADEPRAVSKNTRFEHEQLRIVAEPLREYREGLVKLVAQADALRARMAAISE